MAQPTHDDEARPARSAYRAEGRWWLLLALVFLTAFVLLMPMSWGKFWADAQMLGERLWRLDGSLWLFVLVGFLAEMVKGSTGVGFGAVSGTMLLGVGVPPVQASFGVHIVKILTSASAGLTHWQLRNVNRRLLRVLVLYGVPGSIMGALFLAHSAVTAWITPLVAFYLLLLGVRILIRAYLANKRRKPLGYLAFWAWLGGVLDGIGGGGWGPAISTYLTNAGRDLRYVVGTLVVAEFYVACASSITLLVSNKPQIGPALAGLLLGGLLAAPLAARLTRYVNKRLLLMLVAALVILINLRTLLLALV